MGSADVVSAPPAPPAAYPQADFDANLAKWAKLVASGRKSFDDIVNTVEAKAPLTDEQKAALQSAIGTLQANTVDATPKADPAPAAPTPTADAPTGDVTALEQRLRTAADLDALFTAADLIGSAPTDAQAALTAIFEARQAELGG